MNDEGRNYRGFNYYYRNTIESSEFVLYKLNEFRKRQQQNVLRIIFILINDYIITISFDEERVVIWIKEHNIIINKFSNIIQFYSFNNINIIIFSIVKK